MQEYRAEEIIRVKNSLFMFYFQWDPFFPLKITFFQMSEVVIKFFSYLFSSLCLYLRTSRGAIKNKDDLKQGVHWDIKKNRNNAMSLDCPLCTLI